MRSTRITGMSSRRLSTELQSKTGVTSMNLPSDTGHEYTARAKALFGSHHPLFNAFGVEIARVGKGHAELSMPYAGKLSDRRGALHRGSLVTLLDTTCALAIFSSLSLIHI